MDYKRMATGLILIGEIFFVRISNQVDSHEN